LCAEKLTERICKKKKLFDYEIEIKEGQNDTMLVKITEKVAAHKKGEC